MKLWIKILIGVAILMLVSLLFISFFIKTSPPSHYMPDLDSPELQLKIKEQILKDMQTSEKRLYVSVKSIRLIEENWFHVGIINNNSDKKKFVIDIVPIKKQNPDGTMVQGSDWNSEINFFYNSSIELFSTKGHVVLIKVNAKSKAAGTYLYRIDVLSEDYEGACSNNIGPGCSIYEQESFFVSIIP